jgi:flagellar hook capping protein FlgD
MTLRCVVLGLLLGGGFAALPARATAGVRLAVIPGTQTVPPGAFFDVELDVTVPGSAFNGFDAVVSYNPAALTFQPASPLSAQQGCLMTGGCSAACGQTFHDFHAAGDSLAITDILLCDQISLTGPGQVYKLRFKASTTPQTTVIAIRSAAFYDAGVYVTPVVTSGDSVRIAFGTGVGPTALAAGLRIAAGPNPARGAVALTVTSDRGGWQEIEAHDLAGRLVRRIADGPAGPGVRRLTWDGTDARGARARAGVYLVSVREGGRTALARVVVID